MIGTQPPAPPGPPTPPSELEEDRRQAHRVQVVMVVLLVALLVAIAVLVRSRSPGSGRPGQPAAAAPPAPRATVSGLAQDRVMPPVSLVGEDGKATSLAALHGKVVALAPFLSLCQETCPYTQGAFARLQADVDSAGLGARVALVEVTVDPARDTPARLRAFARLTGSSWTLLTGTPAQVDRLWKFLGVEHNRTAEPTPPEKDWETGKPLTYDVAHTDALYFLGPDGHLRIATFGAPQTTLSPAGRHLVQLEGGPSTTQAPQAEQGWTVAQAVGNLEHLLGKPIPLRH